MIYVTPDTQTRQHGVYSDFKEMSHLLGLSVGTLVHGAAGGE